MCKAITEIKFKYIFENHSPIVLNLLEVENLSHFYDVNKFGKILDRRRSTGVRHPVSGEMIFERDSLFDNEVNYQKGEWKVGPFNLHYAVEKIKEGSVLSLVQ